MEKLPTKSLSKSILLATPLFLLILAILDSSDQLSYLFVLDFLGNVAGKADLTFLPPLQPQTHNPNLEMEQQLSDRGIYTQSTPSPNFPLLNLSLIEEWQHKNEGIVRGSAPRWLAPIAIGKVDALVMVADGEREGKMGIQGISPTLNQKEIALSKELLDKLALKVGQKLQITLKITNLMSATKLFQKYQSFESSEQAIVDKTQPTPQYIAKYLFQMISNSNPPPFLSSLTLSQVQQIVNKIYNFTYTTNFTIKYEYNPNGVYSNQLHDVVVMSFDGLARIAAEIIQRQIIKSDWFQDFLNTTLTQSLSPSQVQSILLSYKLYRTTSSYMPALKQSLSKFLYSYPLIAVITFSNREQLYHPSSPATFTSVLQSSPPYELISIYPFYQDLQGIRFFFKSVIQVFTFISAVIYYYIMALIIKQVYEEKEIEVGIWRVLGSGGVKLSGSSTNQNYMQQQSLQKQTIPTRALLNRLSFKDKLNYAYQIMVNVGYMYYWLISALFSIALYSIVKIIIYKWVSSMLGFNFPPVPVWLPVVLFFLSFIFPFLLSLSHISSIFTSPLVSTIKPVKRTFDLVMVRVIKISTFGISAEMLVVALMLVYYGFVAYYWIPYSILIDDGLLQTLLFNSIFVFMIFGGIILLIVCQSRIERGVLRVLYFLSPAFAKLKLIMLKNIKAKQYKDIKMSIIIAVTFAFLLFFTAGINIQIIIVQSFIERQLGADIVLQNYQKNTFNKSRVEQYLNQRHQTQYSWLSKNINRENIQIQLISGVKPKGIPIKHQFKVITPNYLNSTYYEYYVPEQYIQEQKNIYQTLPNGVVNGFSSIYMYDEKGNNQSMGHYNPMDTLSSADPHQINIPIPSREEFGQYIPRPRSIHMAPQQQIINLAVTSRMRKQLGVSAGDIYKLQITNNQTGRRFYSRAKIVHSLKISPGLDLFVSQAYMSEQQAQYLISIIGGGSSHLQYEKLFIHGPATNLPQTSSTILKMSPQHTQLFQMSLISESFAVMQNGLLYFVVGVTIITGSLCTLFLFVYTLSKCRDEADMFKMLRAIGVSVKQIRLMVFIQVLVRVAVAILNGFALGIMFSVGLSKQIEEVLMINTPALKLKPVFIIAVFMMIVFSFTVFFSTKYLTKRTVSTTDKL